MSIFYISDTHFGHNNIINLSNRPFITAEEMDTEMIIRWNKTVSPLDTVYILGDLCYKSNKSPEKYLSVLNGHKILILGNHDTDIRKHFNKSNKFPHLDKVAEYLGITDTLYGKTRKIVLFHYPITEWNGYYHDSIHLYGHIHNNKNDAYASMSVQKNAFNVGADILDFAPRTLEEVIKYNQLFANRTD